MRCSVFPETARNFGLGLALVLLTVGLGQAADQRLKDPDGLQALRYRSIGPAWGGRMTKVAGVPGTNILYAGAATGGLWKSSNSGLSWEPVLDSENECCVGSLALAPSNPQIIYVGSGEANIRGVAIMGHGIYKSEDGLKSWSHVWEQTGQIGAMAVHPTNPNIAFAAVLGHAYGPNPERGLYRTIDGGKTWTQVLKKDENTGAADVAIDPSNPNHVLATLWQARRTPWSMESGGPGSGLYVSNDGGAIWKQVTNAALPKGPLGKVGIAFAPSRPSRIYALIEAAGGGLFRSEDSGQTWTQVNSNTALLKKAYYFGTVIVNPTNPDDVWFPQRDMFRSQDGGRTFAAVPGTRNGDDFHDVWIDPANSLHIFLGLDSGVQVSLDGGKFWYTPPIPLSQFYNIDVDESVPFRVTGTAQDLGSTAGPSNNLDRGGIRNSEWQAVGGGEAGPAAFDPADPRIVYSGNYASHLTRFDYRTQQAPNLSIFPVLPQGVGAKDIKYRFQYSSPLAISQANPKVLYHGANVLFRSQDGGLTWKAISGDLTRDDKSKEQRTSGLFAWDNVSVEHYCTIFAVAASPHEPDLVWVGSDDGLVHVTRDGGKNWKNVTAAMRGLPEWGTITTIEPSRFDAATAYVTVDASRLDNPTPYLFKTSDYGQTWQRLDAGLPRDLYLRVVREDPKRKEMLYVGTGDGVAYTTDGGSTWHALRLNMLSVPVFGLKVKRDSLIVGTYGRSFWIFDHLNALRDLSPEIRNRQTHLLDVPDAIRWRYSSRVAVPSHGGLGTPDVWKGSNPPQGAMLYYWLREEPKGDVRINILEGSQKLVASLSSRGQKTMGYTDNMPPELKPDLTKQPGLNMAVWNFSYSGAEAIPGSKIKSGNPTAGPLVLPGTYSIQLTVDGQTYTKPIRITMDPRVSLPASDLKDRLDLALAIRDRISHLTGLVLELRAFRERLKVSREAASLVQKLDDLESRMHNASAQVVYDLHSDPKGVRLYAQLIALYEWTIDSDAPVTQGLRDTFASETQELRGYEEELRSLASLSPGHR